MEHLQALDDGILEHIFEHVPLDERCACHTTKRACHTHTCYHLNSAKPRSGPHATLAFFEL